MKNTSVKIINQLNDNYSYLLFSNTSPSSLVIDPAEHNKILPILEKKKLKLDYILITHHHNDHTSGVLGLLKEYPEAQIYSPSELFSLKINRIADGDKIKTSLNEFQVFSSPGHTLDHVVLCDTKNKLLFVGDVLFRLGCGRVFEGTIEQMHNSLNKLLNLSDDMTVYCGHEYTLNNLKFLEHLFVHNDILENTKKQILRDLKLKNKSIPFILGDEKRSNPFLNPECEMASKIKKNNNYSNLEFFRYLREKKDNF
jgi:hydroxyacylglutathione hydrolase